MDELRPQKVEDNRIFDRFSARFPAKFKDTREEYGEKVALRNVSAQGLKLTSKDRLFLHDTVSLEVKLPDNNPPMVFNGEVVWVKAKDPDLWDAGIKFHRLDFIRMSRIYQFSAMNA